MMRTASILMPILLLSVRAPAQEATHAPQVQETSQPGSPGALGGAAIWSHLAGGPRHQSSVSMTGPIAPLVAPSWISNQINAAAFVPVPQSGLVADRDRVYAIAGDPARPGSSFAVAYDRLWGALVWSAPIAPIILDSWSSPTIDAQRDQLIVASGDRLVALDASTGEQRWATPLGSIVVNASPTLTADLDGRNRVFITTYSFGGGSARLVCVNLDPYDPGENPYAPGAIVWEAPLGGDSSGNTPAYSDGIVYVATASGGGSARGKILAFDARATGEPGPSWSFSNTISTGFFGGVAIAHGCVYASSYSFSGLQRSANTVKLEKRTGSLVWSIATNRTDATPVILGNGDLIISGGVGVGAFDFIPFFGSLPSIGYIEDDGPSATLRWDSALETLEDSNGNGVWDFGEAFLSLGGWTHQPIALTIDSVPMLLVGTLPDTAPGDRFGHNPRLSLVDLRRAPGEPDFIIDAYAGSGSTPAVVGGWIYASGEGGITAFAPASISPRRLLRSYAEGHIPLDELAEALRQANP